MAKSNADVARTLTNLWNEGVRSVPTEYLDADVEVDSPFASVSGTPYRGYAGVEQWVRDVDEQFAEWKIHPEDVREVGDIVLEIARVTGRGRESRVELDQPCAVVMTFTAEQRVRRVRIYWDVAAAREAVGVAD